MVSQTKINNLVRGLLGATFILSSVAKIYSLNFFDELVAKQLIGDDYFDHLDQFYWVQWLTRVMISGEFMLGIAVLQERYLKKIVLPFMIGLLVVFTIQVIFEAEVHNKGYIGGNCGCFGDVIPFDNLQTIIKNIVLVAMAAFVYWKYKEDREMNFPPILIPFIVGAVTLFTLSRTFNKTEEVETVDMTQFTIDNNTTSNDTIISEVIKDSAKVKIETIKKDSSIISTAISNIKPKVITNQKSSFFMNYKNFSGGVVKDLDEGTHLICLFSFTCGHCQQAYRDILELRQKGGNTGEVYIIGYGSEFDEKNFWKMTGGKSPFIRIEDGVEFGRLRQGEDFPKIIAMKEGKALKTWNYSTYSKESIFNFFGKTVVPEKKNDGIIEQKSSSPSLISDPTPKSIFD
jgi:hypothetical protein